MVETGAQAQPGGHRCALNTTHRYSWEYPLVAPSVEVMSYQRLAYDDHDSTGRMRSDCTACGTRIELPRQRLDDSAVTMPAPTLDNGYQPASHQVPLDVSEAAANVAARMHLHLD